MHDDVWVDESEFDQPKAFRDMFDLMQPCARFEDLLGAYLAPLRLDLYVQHHVRCEVRWGRRLLASESRMSNGRWMKTRGGGQAPLQEAQGVFSDDVLKSFFLGKILLLYLLLYVCCTPFLSVSLAS